MVPHINKADNLKEKQQTIVVWIHIFTSPPKKKLRAKERMCTVVDGNIFFSQVNAVYDRKQNIWIMKEFWGLNVKSEGFKFGSGKIRS